MVYGLFLGCEVLQSLGRQIPIIGNIPEFPYFRVLKLMLRIYIINRTKGVLDRNTRKDPQNGLGQHRPPPQASQRIYTVTEQGAVFPHLQREDTWFRCSSMLIRPSIYPLSDPECPIFGTLYRCLRVQGGPGSRIPRPTHGDPLVKSPATRFKTTKSPKGFGSNVGVIIIRLGVGGILYYNYTKRNPPKIPF